MARIIRIAAPCMMTLSLAACMGQERKPPAELGLVQPPILGWRLPKTVLDVTVTFVPVTCKDTATGPVIGVKATAEALPRAVPDPDLGPGFPNGLVRVDTRDLASFWTDAAIGYTVHPDSGGLLKTLSSHPVSQAGTIAGNFLTGIVKIASAAALPGPVALGAGKCGDAFAKLADIAKIKARIPGESKKDAEDDAQRIVTLRDAISIVVKKTIDTSLNEPDLDGMVDAFGPDLDDAVKVGWKTLKGSADPRHQVYLILDLEHGNLLAPLSCNGGGAACPRKHSKLNASALFRQAAYIPVLFRLGAFDATGKRVMTGGRAGYAADTVGRPRIVSFGQYGVPGTLPLKIGAFRDTNWSLEFALSGEVTSTAFANKASGVGISSAFAGAAGAASDIDGIGPKAAAALDTETLRLQTDNARLKAMTDNTDLKAKLELQNAAKKDD